MQISFNGFCIQVLTIYAILKPIAENKLEQSHFRVI
jgi:hypothetical protein